MKLKQMYLTLKDASEQGTFTAYANVFGVKDHAGDITQKGAFLESIAAHKAAGTMPKLLSQHEHNKNPIGTITNMYEDEKGLVIEGKFALKTKDGAEAYELIKMDAIDQFSIGYNTIDEKATAEGNLLIKLDVKEVSLVTFPCNEDSRVISVKSEEVDLDKMTAAEKAEHFKAIAEKEEQEAAEKAEAERLEQEAKQKEIDDAKAEEEASKQAALDAEKMRTDLRFNIKSTKANRPITSQKALTVDGEAVLAIEERLDAGVIEFTQDLPTALSMVQTVTSTSVDVRDMVATAAQSTVGVGAEQDGSQTYSQTDTPEFTDSYGGLATEQTFYLISNECLNDPSIDLESYHIEQVGIATDKAYETELWYGTGNFSASGQTSWHGVLTSGYDATESLKGDSERPFGTFGVIEHSVASDKYADSVDTVIDSVNGQIEPNSCWFMNKGTFTQLRKENKSESAESGFNVMDIKRIDGRWHMQGYPVIFSDSMEEFNFGTQDVIAVFGDITKAYKQYVHPSVTQRNEFTIDGSVKVLSRQRRSGLLKDSNALKILRAVA